MRSKLLWPLLAALLFFGCEKRIYRHKYAEPSRPITCLKLQSDNLLTKSLLQDRYRFTDDCPFRLKTTSHFVSTCTSAKAKALGSDFDGFLRFELYERDRLLYRGQIDFKGCLSEGVVSRLFDLLRKENDL
ncbi:MAG: hypothetical protein C6H99_02185 [Epsilonproteobacteria bacterium]|nr:hypothetical protein [Campylobacterota bacterium]NPA64061.1 hypothetical protein [Campylobacterota bacterium]